MTTMMATTTTKRTTTTLPFCKFATLLSVAVTLFASSSSVHVNAENNIIQLTSREFREMAMAGEFNVIIDTRTKLEWETGHIENATLIENLQNANMNTDYTTTTTTTSNNNIIIDEYLNGCENCPIVVYCRSGSRAAQALEILQAVGFTGLLYNGLGTNQWVEAGYDLVVDTPSLLPPCKKKKTMAYNIATAAAATEGSSSSSSSSSRGRCEKSTLEGTYDTMPPLIQDGAVTISDGVNVIVNMPGGGSVTQLTDPPRSSSSAENKPTTQTKSGAVATATTTTIINRFLIMNLASALILGQFVAITLF